MAPTGRYHSPLTCCLAKAFDLPQTFHVELATSSPKDPWHIALCNTKRFDVGFCMFHVIGYGVLALRF
jgi:hypothetical protein